MMRQLRESTKVIMIIVAVAFVGLMVFEWGMDLSGGTSPVGTPTVLGSVNGADITLEEYQRQYQILLEQAERRAPEGLSVEDLEKIEEEAWDDVVTLTLLRQEARERGMDVTDVEVVQFIKYNPPPDMVDLPAFQTEGQFDLEKYQQALADPALGETWAEYERQIRRILPIQKLEEQVVAGVEVTEAELRAAYRERNERARIEYLYLDPDRLVPDDRVTVSRDEIARHYDENRERYRRAASAKIRYAAFPTEVTATDSAAVKALADSLVEAAARPDADFAEMAEEHSDDAISARNGGNLGWIRPEAMDPAFAEALRGLEPGEVAGPVQTPFGWHVIRLDDRQTQDGETRFLTRHVLLEVNPSTEALRATRQAAQEFAREAGGSAEAFASAARERGVEVRETPLFEKGIVVPGLGPAPTLTEFVFSNDAGSVSAPIERNGVYYVVRIDERYPAGYVALDRVAGAIRSELVTRKKREEVRTMAPGIAETVRQRGLAGAANQHGLEVVTTGWFNRMNDIPGVGSGTPVAGAAFGLAEGQVAGPVEAPNGLYFIRLLEKDALDPAAFERERPSLREQLRREKMQAVFNTWFETLRERADVEDRRAELLGA